MEEHVCIEVLVSGTFGHALAGGVVCEGERRTGVNTYVGGVISPGAQRTVDFAAARAIISILIVGSPDGDVAASSLALSSIWVSIVVRSGAVVDANM